jgi:4-alpha-glucanotransferase
MTGTHDTEPLALWWESLPAKEQDVWGLPDRSFTEEVRDGLLQRIYDAGSNLVLLPVLDVFGWRERINQPATISKSNWSFVPPWPVERWGDEPVARDAADRLTAWGYRSGRWTPVDEE